MVQTSEVNICERNCIRWQLLSYSNKLIRWQLSYSSKRFAVLVAILMSGGGAKKSGNWRLFSLLLNCSYEVQNEKGVSLSRMVICCCHTIRKLLKCCTWSRWKWYWNLHKGIFGLGQIEWSLRLHPGESHTKRTVPYLLVSCLKRSIAGAFKVPFEPKRVNISLCCFRVRVGTSCR